MDRLPVLLEYTNFIKLLICEVKRKQVLTEEKEMKQKRQNYGEIYGFN